MPDQAVPQAGICCSVTFRSRGERGRRAEGKGAGRQKEKKTNEENKKEAEEKKN